MRNETVFIVDLIFKLKREIIKKSLQEKNNRFPFLHYITLCFIKKKKPSMKEIASFLNIKPSSATSLVSTLEKQKYVKRFFCQNDRRKINIMITLQGEKNIYVIKRKIRNNMQKKLKRLSFSEKKQLIKILTKLSLEE